MKTEIIILSKNIQLLTQCIESINPSRYKNLTITVGDTGLENRDSLIKYDINFVKIKKYKFSTNNNVLAKKSKADFLIFMNDDIIMMPKWDVISKMQEHFKNNFKTLGTIGTRLFFANQKVQHGGIIFINTGSKIVPTHAELNQNKFHNENIEVMGNTGAFLGINKKVFDDIGGFDETYNECYEDIVLNLECKKLNLKNIFLGNMCGAYHLDGTTRNMNVETDLLIEQDRVKFQKWYIENFNKFMK